MGNLYNMINSVSSNCKDPTLLGSFIENHDNARFARYEVMAFLTWEDTVLTAPVTPRIYPRPRTSSLSSSWRTESQSSTLARNSTTRAEKIRITVSLSGGLATQRSPNYTSSLLRRIRSASWLLIMIRAMLLPGYASFLALVMPC